MSYLKHKPGSIEELMANEASKLNDNAYQDMFKKELDKAGKGIGGMSPKEKKDFFNNIDNKYKAKSEVKEDVSLDKNLNEFKKMTVSFKTHDMMSKASTDLAKQGFTISGNQKALKVNGNGADLNKYATDLQNNYGATVRAESFTEEDAYDKDDEKPAKPKSKIESWKQAWEAATHKMPDGTMMKGDKHKDEELSAGQKKLPDALKKVIMKKMSGKDESNDVDNGDEKKPVSTKDAKKLADSGSKLTKVETEPNADFKN